MRLQVNVSEDLAFLGSGEGRAALECPGPGGEAGETKASIQCSSACASCGGGDYWPVAGVSSGSVDAGFLARLRSFRAFRVFRRCSPEAV